MLLGPFTQSLQLFHEVLCQVGIADKAGATNKTIVLRATRSDGLIMQPDRPATFIESMFDGSVSGHIWATHSVLEGVPQPIFSVLSIDVNLSYTLKPDDLYPRMVASVGWVVHRWGATCTAREPAVGSGCVDAVNSEVDMPTIRNDRAVAVANDTHRFDLHTIAPILANGWVLLGDVERYVPTSSKRFARVQAAAKGSLSVSVVGAPTERVRVTALRPKGHDEWTVAVEEVVFPAGCVAKRIVGQPEPACTESLVFGRQASDMVLKTSDDTVLRVRASGPRGAAEAAADGSAARPFRSIHAARDHLRMLRRRNANLGAVTVLIGAGRYPPLELQPEDSGTVSAPVTYQAERSDGSALISAGVHIPASSFSPWAGHAGALKADLSTLPIELGALGSGGSCYGNCSQYAHNSVVFDDRLMVLARYPVRQDTLSI